MKNNAKFEEELTCPFKVMCHDNEEWQDMRNLMNFDSSARKSKKFANWLL